MSDDFDLRLRKELRALADAVPAGPQVPPAWTARGAPSARASGSKPVVARIRLRHGPSVGWSAAAVGLVLVVVAGVALVGGGRNGRSGASAATASPEESNLPGLTTVPPQVVASFGTDTLGSVVLGPDGAAYVLDVTAKTVFRVDLESGARMAVMTAGQGPMVGGSAIGNPRLLTVGGGDVLMLDDSNSLWAFRPAAGDTAGRGTLKQVNIPDNASWGVDARAIGSSAINPELPIYTSAVNSQLGLYDFYIVTPSHRQILLYHAAPDFSGYPTADRSNYLAVSQDLSSVDDMYIGGQENLGPLYLVQDGKITRYVLGQKVEGWSPAAPGGPAPYYTRLTADNSAQDQGTFYAYDRANRRIVASKSDGAFVGQYMAPAGTQWFSALTGMFVTPGTIGSNPTLYWTESGNLMIASLSSSPTPTRPPLQSDSSPLTGELTCGWQTSPVRCSIRA